MNNLQEENRERLDYLCRNSHKWLIGAAFKVCKNLDVANELVCDLYLYLGERINPALWYDEGDIKSFNLQYCRKFIHSRNLNRIKSIGRRNDLLNIPYWDDGENMIWSSMKSWKHLTMK